jgi:hypothetical protein
LGAPCSIPPHHYDSCQLFLIPPPQFASWLIRLELTLEALLEHVTRSRPDTERVRHFERLFGPFTMVVVRKREGRSTVSKDALDRLGNDLDRRSRSRSRMKSMTQVGSNDGRTDGRSSAASILFHSFDRCACVRECAYGSCVRRELLRDASVSDMKEPKWTLSLQPYWYRCIDCRCLSQLRIAHVGRKTSRL